MIDPHQLSVFIPVIVVMVLLPGPDVLFVLAQSARGGVRDGLLATLGIVTAFLCVHVTGAALGLSTLIVHSVLLFGLLKYAGAAYLVYIGLRTLMTNRADEPARDVGRERSKAPFVQGFVTNVLNPKVAIFTLSFLPQFVVVARGNVAAQIFELGAIWGVAGVVVLSVVAMLGGRFALLRTRSARVRKWERYVTGTLYVSLGLRVAIPDNR